MVQRIEIKDGWRFKQSSTSPSLALSNRAAADFLPVSQFPTVAHLDLLHHKLIPDPYLDQNEELVLWVNDADWTYQTEFPSPPPAAAAGVKSVLVFDGLDTVVDVRLNGELVLASKNMHVSHRVDVSALLAAPGVENTLELNFRAAPAFARKERERIGYKGNGTDVHFGGSERLFLRKAQYHWGWDWGPSLCTQGPWKGVFLETYVARIDDFLVTQSVPEDLKSAVVTVKGTVEGRERGTVEVKITDPEGNLVAHEELKVKEGKFSTFLTLPNPALWYPFTYGAQPLYSITATLSSSSSTRTQALGLRRLRLLQHPLKDQPGTSFLFEINNLRVFCGGSCWIPGDYLLPRMTPKRYEEWLTLAKSGNQAMIRVWGGGIVEDAAFYDVCDREGILVWQDFLFACGDYPASADFVEEVRQEAEQQVKRVGHHPSLVIWAGNNEDYMLADRWGWEWDKSDEKGPWGHTNFPARIIYERTLPKVVEEFGGDVPYWRSSPYGGATANDVTVGDTHIWDVWHGKMAPYQQYKDYTSRFISEFGFESAPNLRTLHRAITNPKERHSQSRTFDIHDKGPGHTRRYPMYMGENFRFRMNPLPDFIYCTQFLQAEAMSYAYNCWRREFRGPGQEYCSGVLVWQLNDIWPGTSWALVDVDYHLKPSFYITKRALAPVVVGMERVVTKEPSYILFGYPDEKHAIDVWVASGLLKERNVVLKLSAFDVETGKKLELATMEKTLTMSPNQSTEIISRLAIPNANHTVVVAYIEDESTSEQLARWVSWPEPLRELNFSQDVKVKTRVEDEAVFLSADYPVKGVVVSIPIESGEDALFDDNFVDLVPGEEVRIGVKDVNGRKLQTRFLCDWELEEGFVL